MSNSPNSSYHDASLGSRNFAGRVLGGSRYLLDRLNCPSNTSATLPQTRVEARPLDLQESRILKIGGIPLEATPLLLFDKLSEFGDIREIYTKDLLPNGFCVVSYFDLGDAIRAFEKLQLEDDVVVQYCPEGYAAMLANISIGGSFGITARDNNSDLTCVLYSGGRLRWSSSRVFHILSTFGALCKFTAIENSHPPTFLVCFNNYTHGCETVDALDGQYAAGFRMGLGYTDTGHHASKNRTVLMQYREYNRNNSGGNQAEGLYCPLQLLGAQNYSTADRDALGTKGSRSVLQLGCDRHLGLNVVCPKPLISGDSGLRAGGKDNGTNSAGNLDHGLLRPMNPLACSVASTLAAQDVEEEGLPYYGDTISQGGDGLHNQLQVPGKNVIDLERIEHGLDTRTTVMLRNIPNKVDQQTLKEYVDATSKAQYNFLYLRIDFRNVCNVGYAFINFIDPLDIIEFVKAKSGTRWNKFNSEKVLDVTYANIQGIDQLVEKFRNSSVMDQDPSYRPKLFHSSGPLIGTEMEFPAANNILKKCRSVSAAQQIVGLFAPKMSKGVWRKRD
ncbi:hypothetical protein C7212DRAFT_291733 [Tuber magnatum]|uniref:RRM domain-containing protein n=1 Tax=Tuber magnatum TaxID=42249 RepID=A0A317T0S6_9PEZI|nr:hypothetical protein C7212DRAFT_291733 [Tuber magnatum]